MTVPLSDEVASSEPVELIERKESGDLCACMTFATVKVRVEKRRTSPDWCWEEVDDDATAVPALELEDEKPLAVVARDMGDGTGEGYAK